MSKPYGMDEYDGYPMPEVPKNRKPLSKEEEERIGAELRKNIREILKTSPLRKEPLYRRTNEQRKIG